MLIFSFSHTQNRLSCAKGEKAESDEKGLQVSLMTKANRGFTLMHNRSKFHEKRGFRLEQIRQKQAKGFGRTPSFRHDIGFRLEQIRLKQTKGFGKASGFGCVKRSIFGTLSLQAEQTEGLAVPRKAIGYRMGINGLRMSQYMREKAKVSALCCALSCH